MSDHQHCPNCSDNQNDELQKLAQGEEMSCCQDKVQEPVKDSKKPIWQKFISIFQKND